MLIRGLLLILLSLLALVGRAEVCVEDDASRSLCLAQPAKRIVAFAWRNPRSASSPCPPGRRKSCSPLEPVRTWPQQ